MWLVVIFQYQIQLAGVMAQQSAWLLETPVLWRTERERGNQRAPQSQACLYGDAEVMWLFFVETLNK
jgi:hypothetical protein